MSALMMTEHQAEELLATSAAGYVEQTHPDVFVAILTVGWEKAKVFFAKSPLDDALLHRTGGCYGKGRKSR